MPGGLRRHNAAATDRYGVCNAANTTSLSVAAVSSSSSSSSPPLLLHQIPPGITSNILASAVFQVVASSFLSRIIA